MFKREGNKLAYRDTSIIYRRNRIAAIPVSWFKTTIASDAVERRVKWNGTLHLFSRLSSTSIQVNPVGLIAIDAVRSHEYI